MSTPKRSSERDFFEKALDEKSLTLKDCQAQNNAFVEYNGEKYGSCMHCAKIIGCELRKTYVSAVYNSMSKGDTGGFEF
ncbi:MAG: hypothetical protein PHE67_09780 [Campylobacterales bacterium]|nr:hypothetical protein [Campylobacterales bacterium]